jgi:hypothetical protein
MENALAKKIPSSNGRDRLEEAMALLIQNQASFLSDMRQIERASSERFARIETDMNAIMRILADHSRILADHGRILADHGRLLERLPDAIRDKIGFKG